MIRGNYCTFVFIETTLSKIKKLPLTRLCSLFKWCKRVNCCIFNMQKVGKQRGSCRILMCYDDESLISIWSCLKGEVGNLSFNPPALNELSIVCCVRWIEGFTVRSWRCSNWSVHKEITYAMTGTRLISNTCVPALGNTTNARKPLRSSVDVSCWDLHTSSSCWDGCVSWQPVGGALVWSQWVTAFSRQDILHVRTRIHRKLLSTWR